MKKPVQFVLSWLVFGLLAGGAGNLALAQSADEPETTETSDADEKEPIDPADDIFLPSEEIHADSDISFPSDI